MKLTVAAVRPITDTVTVYRLVHPRRPQLPPAAPGAHVDVHLADGKVRQYSLCGDLNDDTGYEIAVKREDGGRGGSLWIHDNLREGAIVPVTTPRNNFPLVQGAAHYILIAGGIGITTMMSMIGHLAGNNMSFELHYCARAARTAPFLAQLRELCEPPRLFTYFSQADGETTGHLNVQKLLSSARPETHVYCCGPQRLTQAVSEAGNHWPPGSIHFEHFKATLDENFVPEPFDVKLASTGEVIRIPANRSALEVLRARGMALPASCELGVCGACACRYLEGVVIHRDAVLDITARQDQMMLCVSRARVGVTLDI